FLCTLEITDPVIPDEYRDLAEVFSKAKSEELPPHRGSLDHAIPLEKDSKPVFGPIYNLSETELQVLREYIDEKLRNGFIRPSTSPFGSLACSSATCISVGYSTYMCQFSFNINTLFLLGMTCRDGQKDAL